MRPRESGEVEEAHSCRNLPTKATVLVSRSRDRKSIMASSADHAGDELSNNEIRRRMERGLRRALSTPPQPHGKNPKTPALKRKERPGSKGRVHKGKDA